MNQIVNPIRVLEIMKHVENKELFIIELITAINYSVVDKNQQILEDFLYEWEATAELNSIPGFASKVNNRYRLLVKAGLINAE
jgi:hypothetical protein